MTPPRALFALLREDERTILEAALDYFASNLERDMHHGDVGEEDRERTEKEVKAARALSAEIAACG